MIDLNSFLDIDFLPEFSECVEVLSNYYAFTAAAQGPDFENWKKRHFGITPWGFSFNMSKAKYERSVASANRYNKALPQEPDHYKIFRYLIVAVMIDWDQLVANLKRTIKNWGYTPEDLQKIYNKVWSQYTNVLVNNLIRAQKDLDQASQSITEAVEKHETLNPKLFTKDERLKDRVHDKMLEIVDTFLADLKEQEIEIKVDDILLIGSNASYNYTKDSDIDLHILADSKAVKYDPEVSNALYGAYRTLFNKNLDIEIFDIPLEIFVELEDSPRVSNGVYSVKQNKWVKRPIPEAIPEYDKEALKKLVDVWEAKCKKVLAAKDADKLKDETKVVKLLEDIYEKLRKKGVAKGEYALENLAFKELRNNGYLDKLKDGRNELISKRLSLEERLDKQQQNDLRNLLTKTAGTQPIIQENGQFYFYNIKDADLNRVTSALRALDEVKTVYPVENGKYDFSQMATTHLPSRYYNIRGELK